MTHSSYLQEVAVSDHQMQSFSLLKNDHSSYHQVQQSLLLNWTVVIDSIKQMDIVLRKNKSNSYSPNQLIALKHISHLHTYVIMEDMLNIANFGAIQIVTINYINVASCVINILCILGEVNLCDHLTC